MCVVCGVATHPSEYLSNRRRLKRLINLINIRQRCLRIAPRKRVRNSRVRPPLAALRNRLVDCSCGGAVLAELDEGRLELRDVLAWHEVRCNPGCVELTAL